MSWDGYIDNLVGQSKDASGSAHCDKAAIIGLDGSKWTSDGHAKVRKPTTRKCYTVKFTSLKKKIIHFIVYEIRLILRL